MYLQLAENPIPSQVTDNFTFVPGINGNKGMWIRDDQFDKLNDRDFNDVMEVLAPHQPMSELSGARKDRKAEKKQAKIEGRKARTEIKKAKAEGIRAGTFQPGSTGKDIIGSIGSVASSIFGKPTPGGEVEMPGGGAGGSAEETPFYKKPAVIIGGIVVIGAVLFFATRKKK